MVRISKIGQKNWGGKAGVPEGTAKQQGNEENIDLRPASQVPTLRPSALACHGTGARTRAALPSLFYPALGMRDTCGRMPLLMLEFTPRAAEILRRSTDAARRFNPDARIRIFRRGDGVEFALAEGAEPGDREIEGDGFRVLVAEGVEGVVAVVEPHDQLVLRPDGSSPLPGEVLEAEGH